MKPKISEIITVNIKGCFLNRGYARKPNIENPNTFIISTRTSKAFTGELSNVSLKGIQ